MNGCGCTGARCRIGPDDHRHGTANGYDNLDCRCPRCREAHRVDMAEARRRKRHETTCPNCGQGGGLYANNTCEACWHYQHVHGVRRPPSVYDPPDPPCGVCGVITPPGRRWNGRCGACYRYLRRHGVDRDVTDDVREADAA